MEKLEISAVIKYFCKKGMPPKEINEDFMETLGENVKVVHTLVMCDRRRDCEA